MEKTLLGKEGWLFLKNDAARELEVHCNNLCIPNEVVQRSRYATHLHKYCLTIFPNKSYLYSVYLPDGYNAIYRPGFNVYKKMLKDHLLDGYEILKGETETFYKTDTHINFKGAYLVYREWVRHVNKLFSLHIPILDVPILRKFLPSLAEVGVGDLTVDSNRGSVKIEDTSDAYFYTDSIAVTSPFLKYTIGDGSIQLLSYTLENVTHTYHGKILDWNVLSKHVLFIKGGSGEKRVLIFHDSFLLSTMSLYMNIFNETYMAKHTYDPALVDLIKPDYVFEFRVERFLL